MQMKQWKVAIALTALTTACAIGMQAQETREDAASHLRKVDPKEMDPSYNRKAAFAQKLVDDALAKHPEVLLLAIHGGAPKYDIIASNFGRIGKLGDEDDLRCIRTGKDNLEISKEGNHFEDEMPLKDKAGKTIGSLGVVFRYKPGDNKLALQKIAHDIEKEMQVQITDTARLFGPA
jgi:hypothetical protein